MTQTLTRLDLLAAGPRPAAESASANIMLKISGTNSQANSSG